MAGGGSMLIYVVIAQYETGCRDERAFAFHRAARAYTAALSADTHAEILEVPVVGELACPDLAYTLRWNDDSEDTYNVEAVYGNGLLARFAVGRHGRVEQIRIDCSMDAADAILALHDRVGGDILGFRQLMAGMRQNRAQRLRRLA